MNHRDGITQIRVGDNIETDQRPYPVLVLEIIEEQGMVRFIDKEGIEDFGKPGMFNCKYEINRR